MRRTNLILNGLREYEVTYGRRPTHISLTQDELTELNRELGQDILPGDDLWGMIVRVFEHTGGVEMLPPVGGDDGKE